MALGLLNSPRIFSFYSPRAQRICSFKLLIVQCEVRNKISVKQERCVPKIPGHALEKNTRNLFSFFFLPLSRENTSTRSSTRSLVRSYL